MLVAAVTDDAPRATSPFWVLAVAPLPNANELSFPAVDDLPIAVVFTSVAFALLPTATAKSFNALESGPTATVQIPVASAWKPTAVAACALAFA